MVDGVPYRETLDTESEARDWETVTQAQRITGTLPGTATLDAYAPRWLDTYRGAPASTASFHEVNVRLYIRPALGRRRMSTITRSDISRTLNTIADEVSVAKADAVYRTASALFRSAVADGVVPTSPVHAKRHRPRTQPEPKVALERGQAAEVLAHLDGWQLDTAIVQLSLGARYGEVAGLTPADVDLDRGRVTIRRRWNASNYTVRATKNHRLRTLDLPALARGVVERLVEEHDGPTVPDLASREHDGRAFDWAWLITTEAGRPPNLGAYNKALARACAQARAPAITSHGWRHTYVSWMVAEGYGADLIGQWIGDTPETVRKVYSHMLDASSAPAAAAIDSVLGGALGPSSL